MHEGRPYDPVKAHEYYERTKQLKGRKKGSASTIGGASKPRAADNQEKKVAAAEQVARLRSKLAQLQAELKKRMAEARKADAKAKKPATAAEKSEAARDAKKYRDKNKQKIKTEAKKANAKEARKSGGSGGGTAKGGSSKASGNSVEDLKQTIQQVQTSLRAAVARQRALG
jgi:hypothetical protein